MKFFFDSNKIIEQLNSLPDDEKLDFIDSNLFAIDQYYKGKPFGLIPVEVRQLKKDLNDEKLHCEKFKAVKENKNADIISAEPEEKKVSQRDRIRKFLHDNYRDFIKSSVSESLVATEITDLWFPDLKGSKRKRKINAIRVELVGIRNGTISLKLSSSK